MLEKHVNSVIQSIVNNIPGFEEFVCFDSSLDDPQCFNYRPQHDLLCVLRFWILCKLEYLFFTTFLFA